jgi:hypothetical protein
MPGAGGNPLGMTSNKLKLLFAGAGVGAVLAMTGISAVQTTTFSADPDPFLPTPTVPGIVTEVTESPTGGPTLEAETPTYTTTTTAPPAP